LIEGLAGASRRSATSTPPNASTVCPGEVEDDFLLIDDDCVVILRHDDHGRLVLGMVQIGGMLDRNRLVSDLVWEAAVRSGWSRDLN
jgi:hypothetical protein